MPCKHLYRPRLMLSSACAVSSHRGLQAVDIARDQLRQRIMETADFEVITSGPRGAHRMPLALHTGPRSISHAGSVSSPVPDHNNKSICIYLRRCVVESLPEGAPWREPWV